MRTITITATISIDYAGQDKAAVDRMLRSEIEDAIRNADLSGTNSDERGEIGLVSVVSHSGC